MRMSRHWPDYLADMRIAKGASRDAMRPVLNLVPFTWIEHVASPLPRECSTTELKGQNLWLLTPRNNANNRKLERVKGIEPSS